VSLDCEFVSVLSKTQSTFEECLAVNQPGSTLYVCWSILSRSQCLATPPPALLYYPNDRRSGIPSSSYRTSRASSWPSDENDYGCINERRRRRLGGLASVVRAYQPNKQSAYRTVVAEHSVLAVPIARRHCHGT